MPVPVRVVVGDGHVLPGGLLGAEQGPDEDAQAVEPRGQSRPLTEARRSAPFRDQAEAGQVVRTPRQGRPNRSVQFINILFTGARSAKSGCLFY